MPARRNKCEHFIPQGRIRAQNRVNLQTWRTSGTLNSCFDRCYQHTVPPGRASPRPGGTAYFFSKHFPETSPSWKDGMLVARHARGTSPVPVGRHVKPMRLVRTTFLWVDVGGSENQYNIPSRRDEFGCRTGSIYEHGVPPAR